MVGWQVDVHSLHVASFGLVETHHLAPASELVECQNRNRDAGDQQQHRLHEVRPDDRLQSAEDCVRRRDACQQNHEQSVVAELDVRLGGSRRGTCGNDFCTWSRGCVAGSICRRSISRLNGGGLCGCGQGDFFNSVATEQNTDRPRADVKSGHHLHDGHDDDHYDGVRDSAAVVVAFAEILRQRVHTKSSIHRQKEIAQDHQAKNRTQFEVALEEADAESDSHHTDHMVSADVGAVDRAGDSPPGDCLASEEVVFGRLLFPAGDQTDDHHAEQRCEEQNDVQSLKDFTHTHQADSQIAEVRAASCCEASENRPIQPKPTTKPVRVPVSRGGMRCPGT